MIDSIILSYLFVFPGSLILSVVFTNFKYKYLLTPFISFAYFNFLSILFFILDLSPFRFWFYFFAVLPSLIIFKIKLKKEFFMNFISIGFGFIFINNILNYFSFISLPGNTNLTFDEIYKVFYLGTESLDIGLIPLPMFTSGLFTTYNFNYSIINIFFIQYIFTALFSILNYVSSKKDLLIAIVLLFSNLLVFEVLYELISYRSHSLTASALMILFVNFHKFKDSKPENLILFFTIFILFNSRLENVLFGYLYIFTFKLLNSKKFEASKSLFVSASLLSGLYLMITLNTLPDSDIRSNTLFIAILVCVGTLLIYKSFLSDKFIFSSLIFFVIFYSLMFYILEKEVFRSVISVVYTKLLDPNSGFGLQFILIICIFLALSNRSLTIPKSFFNLILFILLLTILIGILQTYIYVPEASVEYIENMSIFNPLDLSIFRGLVQTISVMWLFKLPVVLEHNKKIEQK